MTGMERLRAVAEDREFDRIPVFCNLLDQGARELGLPLKEYYSKGEYVAEGQLRMRSKYGYDNLWSLFYVGKEAELLGCDEFIFAAEGPPNVGRMIIDDLIDIDRLEVPEDITGHPAFAESLNCLKILTAEAKGQYPICAYLTASMSLPALLMGMEKWLSLLMMGPSDYCNRLLEKCSQFFQREVAAYRQAGADIILYSNPFGSIDIISDKIFNEFSMPWMEKDLLPVGTGDLVYYCGGSRINPVIERVIERLKIKTFYLSPMDSIAEGKRIAAGRAVCAGVINDIRLIDWTALEVSGETRRIIEEGMPGGKFIFGTLAMPYRIPEENIKAMLDTAFRIGRYQGR